jgi:hypothetical protein
MSVALLPSLTLGTRTRAVQVFDTLNSLSFTLLRFAMHILRDLGDTSQDEIRMLRRDAYDDDLAALQDYNRRLQNKIIIVSVCIGVSILFIIMYSIYAIRRRRRANQQKTQMVPLPGQDSQYPLGEIRNSDQQIQPPPPYKANA